MENLSGGFGRSPRREEVDGEYTLVQIWSETGQRGQLALLTEDGELVREPLTPCLTYEHYFFPEVKALLLTATKDVIRIAVCATCRRLRIGAIVG